MARIKYLAMYFVSPDGTVTLKAKPNIPMLLVREVYKRDNFVCQVCGCKVRRGGSYDTPFDDFKRGKCRSIDHIFPVSKGGQHILSNLRVLCKSCNCSKQEKINVSNN